MFGTDPKTAIEIFIILLISIDIHELAHAWVADRLGDPTPRRMGQLSPNPFVHMDQFGLLLLVILSLTGRGFTFGRTNVTPSNLKFGPQRGGAIVALVGPVSNLLLATICAIVLNAGIGGTISISTDGLDFLYQALYLNVLLFVLNLVPLPPLDGFTILSGFLTSRQLYSLAPLIQWGPLILLLLFLSESQVHILGNTVYPAVDQITRMLCTQC
jgi:Zn-dependent protease